MRLLALAHAVVLLCSETAGRTAPKLPKRQPWLVQDPPPPKHIECESRPECCADEPLVDLPSAPPNGTTATGWAIRFPELFADELMPRYASVLWANKQLAEAERRYLVVDLSSGGGFGNKVTER